MLKRILALTLAGAMGMSMTIPSVAADEKTIYMVANSHLDTVWSWDLEETIGELIPRTFQENFELIDKYPEYQFNFEGAYRYQLLEEYYPELFEKLKKYIDSGNWNVAGSALENGDVNVPSPEALFRNILYGNNYFEDNFGVRSKDIFLPDCFGFGFALPSIISHSNLLGFSTQKLSWGVALPGNLPFDLGLWKGPDGKSIIANINYNSYVSTFGEIRTNSDLLNRLQRSPINKIAALYGTGGDKGGGVPESTIKVIANEMSKNSSNQTKVYFASTDDLFKGLAPEDINKLTTYEGELLMTAHGTGSYTSRAISKRWNRKGELLGDAAERANVAAFWLGSTQYPTKKFEEIWTRIIAHQFHDDITGTSNTTTYYRSFNDYMTAIKQFAAEYENGVAGVAALMDTTVSQGVPVVVNNPVAADRVDVVEADVKINSSLPYVRVFDNEGNEVPSQVLAHVGDVYKIAFLADVKSLGYRTYNVRASNIPCQVKTDTSVGNKMLTNSKYRVTIDNNGDISSIYDKELGKELLSQPIRLGLFDQTYAYWAAWELNINDYAFKRPQNYVSSTPEISIVENGPARVAMKIVRTYGDSTFTQIVKLGAGSSVVRVDNVVDWHQKSTLLKAEFNLAASNPTATYDLGLGVIQRGNNTSYKAEVPHQKWADLTDKSGNFGVSIINDSKYGTDKYNDNTLRLTLIHTPHNDYTHDSDTFGSEGEYFSAGQRVQDFGENRFSFGIYGHAGSFSDSDIQIEAEAFNQPMNAFQTVPHSGPLGANYSFGSVDNDKVLVRAIKKAERTNEVIIRVNEGSGQEQKGVKIRLGNGIKSAREVYASEEEIGPANVVNGNLVFDIGAFGVKSFAVTLEDSNIQSNQVKSVAVDLPYNIDAYSGNQNRKDGGLNLVGDCYPAELLPDTIVSGGISYRLGSKNDGQKNAVACDGQTIPLPSGYSTLKILAASLNGDRDAVFSVDGKDITLNIADFSENIATWDLPYLGVTGYVKEQTPAIVATHRHTNGRDNIAATTYMFSYSIDITGAKSISLPKDKNIVIFAATAVDDKNTKLEAISPMYDRRERSTENKDFSFKTGFEDSDTQVRTNYTTNYNGTSDYKCEVTTERVKSGSKALKISGKDNSSGTSFVYFTLYEEPIIIKPGTILSYSFYAQNELGRYIAVDMEFGTGAPLRDRRYILDDSGIQIHPARGRGKVGEWVTVTVDLYKYLPGENITKLMVAYDHPGDTGEFTAYIDDLFIGVKEDYLSTLIKKAGQITRGNYSTNSLLSLDNAVNLARAVLDSDYSAAEKNAATAELENALKGLVKHHGAYDNIPAWEFNDKKSGTIVIDTDSSGNPTNIGGVSPGSWAVYKGIEFGLRGSDSISVYYSGWNTGDDPVIEVRLGDYKGELIGTINIPQTSTQQGSADWSKYTLASAKLTKVITGEQDICLVFIGGGSHVCNLAYFVFQNAPPKAALTQLYNFAKQVDRSRLPQSKLEQFDNAVEVAKIILDKPDATQAEIDTAYLQLKEALDAINDGIMIGDINQDGQITVVDIIYLRNLIMERMELTPLLFELSDVNGDGRLTITDIVGLRNIIMNRI